MARRIRKTTKRKPKTSAGGVSAARRKPKAKPSRKTKVKRAAPKFKIAKSWKRLTIKEVESYERAERIIGKEKIRKGTKRIGTTKFIRPTKAGFNKLRSILRKVSKPENFTRFSYDLRIEFMGKRGRKVRIAKNGIGIPKYNKGNHSKFNKRRQRKKLPKLDKNSYFEYLVYNRIRRLIFGAIREVWGKYPSKTKKLEMTKGQIRKLMTTVKKQNARFSFGLNRES